MPQERRSPATGEREAGTVGARGAGSLRELPAAEVTGTAQALNLWAWGRSLALETVAGATPPMRITGDDRAVAELAVSRARLRRRWPGRRRRCGSPVTTGPSPSSPR